LGNTGLGRFIPGAINFTFVLLSVAITEKTVFWTHRMQSVLNAPARLIIPPQMSLTPHHWCCRPSSLPARLLTDTTRI